MDQQLENKCLNLAENYRILSAGNKLEFTEMILACAGIYLAAGREPDMDRIQECKKLLKSKAGIFSNFRGSDELLVRCKMALSADPELYFENLEREYKRLKTFFSGEQTVLAAMILAEQGAAAEGLAEKTKQIYKEMKEAHPWLTSENDLPFAALMAASGRDAVSVYAEAEEIYSLLKGNLKAERDTLQMLVVDRLLHAQHHDAVLKAFAVLPDGPGHSGGRFRGRGRFCGLGGGRLLRGCALRSAAAGQQEHKQEGKNDDKTRLFHSVLQLFFAGVIISSSGKNSKQLKET